MRLIGTREKFSLFERGVKDGWTSLKLVNPSTPRKKNWWLGWNGERLAKNADAGKLFTHHPETYAWVIAELSKGD